MIPGRGLRRLALAAVAVGVALIPGAFAANAVGGADVKVTNDNNNVDGGIPNPGFDAQNRQSNETTVAISPVDPTIVAAGANDYRMVTVFGDAWYGLYVSSDDGATWFNTMVPGFPSDTTSAGLASPLHGLAAAGDPVVRFDASGDMYLAGIAFNRSFDPADRPLDSAVWVARYDYTPGTPGGVSSANSAANPPDFTYAGTTIVDRGAVGFAVPPGQPFGVAGEFVDKEWMEVDDSATSPCAGNVYVTWTAFHGVGGNFPIRFSASSDGGASFSPAATLSTGGREGTRGNQGSDIAVGPDGTVWVAYRTFPGGNDPTSAVSIVRSSNCGKSWSQPIRLATIAAPQAPGVAFRTPTFALVSADDTNPNTVYVAYQNFIGSDYDIYVQRSTDGGFTWSTPAQANEDPGNRHQIFPMMDVSNGLLHLAWYDFRNSTTPANEALDVYYSSSDAYPTFSPDVRVTDVSHNGNCLMFGGGTAAFHGDYNELAARYDGTNHTVHLAWADNRDVTPCDLDPAAGPASNNTGNRNQNIYADKLIVTP